MFLLDVSGSTSDGWAQMKEFVRRTVTDDRFPVGTDPERFQFAVATFSNSGSVEFDFLAHSGLDSLVVAVEGLSHSGGGTDIAAGLRTARELLFHNPAGGNRPESADILILITDGEDTGTSIGTQADSTKQAGITILCVGIGSGVDQQQLRDISSNDQVFLASNFAVLDSLLDSLTTTTCIAGEGETHNEMLA